VAAGKSPIIEAIQEAEQGTTGEVRVHLSRSFIEKDPFAHAWRIFEQYGMVRTTNRNAVLLYVNLRRKKLALIGDEGIHHAVGQEYWEKIVAKLTEDLRSTHAERAIAHAVRKIGETLRHFFPLEEGARNPNELADHPSED
jgi:uncharacterized membrane protein